MHKNVLTVSDFISSEYSDDVSDILQKIIDYNPNKTIYFPDGKYYITKPIVTPADPTKTVSLKLDAYAQIIAAKNWNGDGALIKLGGKYPANDIRTNGSNSFFEGGIVDGNGIADGISIDGGRETVIRNVSIKHTRIGIHIKKGANNGSSDSDISGVNIVGNGKTDSIGVLAEGWDNTFTSMRISDIFVGVWLKSAGNILRNVHPLYTLDYTDYERSCGFIVEGNRPDNWFDFCYSDQFSTGFLVNARITMHNCFCFWYSPRGKQHIAVRSDEKFNSIVSNLTIGFCENKAKNYVLKTGNDDGGGIIQNLIVSDMNAINDDTYKKYLSGVVIS